MFVSWGYLSRPSRSSSSACSSLPNDRQTSASLTMLSDSSTCVGAAKSSSWAGSGSGSTAAPRRFRGTTSFSPGSTKPRCWMPERRRSPTNASRPRTSAAVAPNAGSAQSPNASIAASGPLGAAAADGSAGAGLDASADGTATVAGSGAAGTAAVTGSCSGVSTTPAASTAGASAAAVPAVSGAASGLAPGTVAGCSCLADCSCVADRSCRAPTPGASISARREVVPSWASRLWTRCFSSSFSRCKRSRSSNTPARPGSAGAFPLPPAPSSAAVPAAEVSLSSPSTRSAGAAGVSDRDSSAGGAVAGLSCDSPRRLASAARMAAASGICSQASRRIRLTLPPMKASGLAAAMASMT